MSSEPSTSRRPQQQLVATAGQQHSTKHHAQWKLMRVISGHTGWVRSLAVDVTNQWFASGAADRTVKIWDTASGTLKVTLTGHIGAVRGLAISARHPYLFSVGDDKMVKCWDLEQNRVVRQYHGHLSGVYSVAIHPTLDLLLTGSRDATVRAWDMRTRQAVHVLGGHKQTISSVLTNECRPQVISASMDATVRLWDVAAGKTMTVLTHHKRSVRALTAHPTEYTFASGASDHVKRWKLPEGTFLHDYEGHSGTIFNALAVNADGVLVGGANDGSMVLWDWSSGREFQRLQAPPQPGSLDCEAAIYAACFDQTGMRLITGEGDKTIKMWCELGGDEEDSENANEHESRVQGGEVI